MAKQQTSKLLGCLVEHQRVFNDIPSADKQWAIQNTQAAINLFGIALKHRTEGIEHSTDVAKLRLLSDYFIRELAEFETVPVESFDIRHHFSENVSSEIKSLGFPRVEYDIPATTLKVVKLRYINGGFPIGLLSALGYNSVVNVSHAFQVVRAWETKNIEWHGKRLKNIHVSINFIVKGSDGALRESNINNETLDSSLFLSSSPNSSYLEAVDEGLYIVS